MIILGEEREEIRRMTKCILDSKREKEVCREMSSWNARWLMGGGFYMLSILGEERRGEGEGRETEKK